MKRKIILTDVDGVLLNWETHLKSFFIDLNYPENVINDIDEYTKTLNAGRFDEIFKNDTRELLKQYNSSDYTKDLKPLDGSTIINKLKDEFDFIAITAFGSDKKSQKNRIENLEKYFPDVFKDIRFSSPHSVYNTKKPIFKELFAEYGDRIICFVDDMPINSIHFHEVNKTVKNFFLERYNGFEIPNINLEIVKNWSQIQQSLEKL